MIAHDRLTGRITVRNHDEVAIAEVHVPLQAVSGVPGQLSPDESRTVRADLRPNLVERVDAVIDVELAEPREPCMFGHFPGKVGRQAKRAETRAIGFAER